MESNLISVAVEWSEALREGFSFVGKRILLFVCVCVCVCVLLKQSIS